MIYYSYNGEFELNHNQNIYMIWLCSIRRIDYSLLEVLEERLRKKMRDVQRGIDVYWDDRIAAIILVAVIEKKMSQ